MVSVLGVMLAVSVACNFLFAFLALWSARNVVRILTEPL